MKKALVVGIDKYSTSPLTGCENDAVAISGLLKRNGDGSPNFDVELLSSDNQTVSAALLHSSLSKLFSGDAETALFYFAGHGIIEPTTNSGFIVSQDGTNPNWGINLSALLEMANKAYPKIKSSIIVLDSCNSGYTGEVQGLGKSEVSVLGSGVTILTACHREGTAAESLGQGLFTSMFIDGLSGSASDICGRITPASVYSHIDQTLGAFEQRPVYKANVQTFVTLRTINPKIPLDVLRRLPIYFKSASDQFKLDPSFEPDRQNTPVAIEGIPPIAENVRVFKELQACNRHGLVDPVNAEHMYFAAINSTSCKLTALGAHYRRLAEANRI